MDKATEREALTKVFGTYAELALDSERPDFIIEQSTFRHGVEVTEFYSSDIVAMLNNVPSYTTGLLDGTVAAHYRDRQHLRVETVSLEYEDGRRIDDLRAIFQPTPTVRDQLDLLLSAIDAKGQKHDEYLKSVDVVDLVIWDRSCLFGRQEAFLSLMNAPLEVRRRFLQMPFREVFLLTRSPEPTTEFYYPIRANLLLADALLIDHSHIESGATLDDPQRIFTIACCLKELGHSISYQANPEESIHCPGWQILFNELSVTLRRWIDAGELQPPIDEDRSSMLGIASETIARLLEGRARMGCENVFIALDAN